MADSMIKVGEFNRLKVARTFDFGMYLGEGKDVVLLPKRFIPAGVKDGDTLNVFVYHDSEDRLIATTQRPKGDRRRYRLPACCFGNRSWCFPGLGIDERYLRSQIKTTDRHARWRQLSCEDLPG